jgi:SAM-dependent methyltransferase
MTDSVEQFYDQLAASYHLIFPDWAQSVHWQGTILAQLIGTELARLYSPEVASEARTVLDCSCGIGTQAIGLAEQGYRVHATDLSPAAVAQARQNAVSFGVALSTGVADMRTLAQQVPGTFDIVLSCDNAVPHLLTTEDLHAATRQMWLKLRTPGLLVVSMRDYDQLRLDRPGGTMPRSFDGPEGRRVYFQVWEWAGDGDSYTVHLFIVRDVAGHWETEHHATRYRALQRDDMAAALRMAGFTDVRWHMPGEGGYYQPIVTACKS